jgi:hypothetical protein
MIQGRETASFQAGDLLEVQGVIGPEPFCLT